MFKPEFLYRLVRSLITSLVFTGVLLLAEYIIDDTSFSAIINSNILLANLIAKAYILSHITGFAKVFLARRKNPMFLISEQGEYGELLSNFISWNILSYFILVLINSFSGELSFDINVLDLAIVSLLSLVNLSLNIGVINRKKNE